MQLEAEEIEGVGTFGGIEGTQSAPAVAVHLDEARLELGPGFGVGLAAGKEFLGPVEALLGHGQDLLVGHFRQPLALALAGGVPEEVVEFDHVAVHVDDAAVSRVGGGRGRSGGGR